MGGGRKSQKDIFFLCCRLLLLHQAFLDLMACAFSTVIHYSPTFWHVNNIHWERFNCYLW